MTETEWLTANHTFEMLSFLDEAKISRRCLRLFACACCRCVWELLEWDAAKRIVELSESFADGEVVAEELRAMHHHSDFDDVGAHFRGEMAVAIRRRRRSRQNSHRNPAARHVAGVNKTTASLN